MYLFIFIVLNSLYLLFILNIVVYSLPYLLYSRFKLSCQFSWGGGGAKKVWGEQIEEPNLALGGQIQLHF